MREALNILYTKFSDEIPFISRLLVKLVSKQISYENTMIVCDLVSSYTELNYKHNFT